MVHPSVAKQRAARQHSHRSQAAGEMLLRFSAGACCCMLVVLALFDACVSWGLRGYSVESSSSAWPLLKALMAHMPPEVG